jgi:uncharacterized protein with HEPN domain
MGARDREFYSEVIRDNIDAIAQYRPDSKEAFLKDARTCDAILMRLFLIAEGLSVLDDDPAVGEQLGPAWQRIIRLRSRIAFRNVDKDVIWELITDSSLQRLRDGLR